jgi:hypothetical protein
MEIDFTICVTFFAIYKNSLYIRLFVFGQRPRALYFSTLRLIADESAACGCEFHSLCARFRVFDSGKRA